MIIVCHLLLWISHTDWLVKGLVWWEKRRIKCWNCRTNVVRFRVCNETMIIYISFCVTDCLFRLKTSSLYSFHVWQPSSESILVNTELISFLSSSPQLINCGGVTYLGCLGNEIGLSHIMKPTRINITVLLSCSYHVHWEIAIILWNIMLVLQ